MIVASPIRSSHGELNRLANSVPAHAAAGGEATATAQTDPDQHLESDSRRASDHRRVRCGAPEVHSAGGDHLEGENAGDRLQSVHLSAVHHQLSRGVLLSHRPTVDLGALDRQVHLATVHRERLSDERSQVFPLFLRHIRSAHSRLPRLDRRPTVEFGRLVPAADRPEELRPAAQLSDRVQLDAPVGLRDSDLHALRQAGAARSSDAQASARSR